MSTRLYYLLSGGAFVFGSLALTRSYLSGTKYTGKEELYGKTVIITGANQGIGKETALDLANRGARVIMACRNLKKCEETKDQIVKQTFNKKVECAKCDLASLESIREFASKINEEEKFVHILINNAGVMWCPKSYTKEGFETHLGVNHLGHFYLTNLILPKIIASNPSRIINLSCRDYVRGTIDFEDLNSSKEYNVDKAYNQSKLAIVYFNQELSKRLKNTGVTANCVDPGYVYSELMRYSSVYNSPYSPISYLFKLFLKNTEMGAQQVIYASVSSQFENVSGKYIRDFKEVDISENAKNEETALRLWLTSKKWTRLN